MEPERPDPTARRVVFENDQATLWYHPAAGIVHHEIHRFLEAGTFQKLLSAGAEVLERHGARKWLSDDEKNVVLAPEDLEWSRTVWRDRVVRAGLRYWAVVNPATTVAALQMKPVIADYRARGVTVEVHADLESALRWLETADRVPDRD